MRMFVFHKYVRISQVLYFTPESKLFSFGKGNKSGHKAFRKELPLEKSINLITVHYFANCSFQLGACII